MTETETEIWSLDEGAEGEGARGLVHHVPKRLQWKCSRDVQPCLAIEHIQPYSSQRWV